MEAFVKIFFVTTRGKEKRAGVTGIPWVNARDVATEPATGSNKKSVRLGHNVSKDEADKISY